MKKFAKLFFYAQVCIIPLLFTSCNLITEPKPIYNNNVVKPGYNVTDITNFTNGQHVDGTIDITFNSGNIKFNISSAELQIDNNNSYYCYKAPWVFSVNTEYFSEGMHKVILNLYRNDVSFGALSMTNPPYISYESNLYFDRSTPLPVSVSTSYFPCYNGNLGAKISWSKSPNLNFAAYGISRSYDNQNWEMLDTIYNVNDTTFYDSSLVKIYGLPVYYKINNSTTRDLQTGYENPATFITGKHLTYNSQYSMLGPYFNTAKNQLYFMEDNKLVVFSTTDNSLIKEINIPNLSLSMPNFTTCDISRDGNTFFIYSIFNEIEWAVDLNSLTVSKTFNVTLNPNKVHCYLYAISSNKFLIKTDDNILEVFDVNSHSVFNKFIAPSGISYSAAAVSPDGSLVYLDEANSSAGHTAYRIISRDLTVNGMPVVSQVNTNEIAASMIVGPDNKTLYEFSSDGNGTLIIRNEGNLQEVNRIYSNSDRMLCFTASANKVYTEYNRNVTLPGNNVIFADVIDCYDLNSLNELNSWEVNDAQNMAVTNNYLYIGAFSQNALAYIIDLK